MKRVFYFKLSNLTYSKQEVESTTSKEGAAAILVAKVSKGQIFYSRILRKRIKPNKTCLVFGKVVDISKMPKHLQ